MYLQRFIAPFLVWSPNVPCLARIHELFLENTTLSLKPPTTDPLRKERQSTVYSLEVIYLPLGSPRLLPARRKTPHVIVEVQVGNLLLLWHSEGLLQGCWRRVVPEVLRGRVGWHGTRHSEAAHAAPAEGRVRRAFPRVGDGGRGGLAVGGGREERRGQVAHLEGLLQGHLARGLQHYLEKCLKLAVTVSTHMDDLVTPLLHRERIILVRAGHLGYLGSTLTPATHHNTHLLSLRRLPKYWLGMLPTCAPDRAPDRAPAAWPPAARRHHRAKCFSQLIQVQEKLLI